MKYYKLDKEEKQILKDYKAGKFVSVKNKKKEIAKYQKCARAMLNKNRNVNVRVSERDLLKIKARAFERGMPYQTLIASLLHQFSNRRIKELAV